MDDSLNMSGHLDVTDKSLGNMSASDRGTKVAAGKDPKQQQQQQQSEIASANGAANGAANAANVTDRARRRKEEAVRRLVSDVQARPDRKLGTTAASGPGIGSQTPGGIDHHASDSANTKESQDWIIASTVAIALERGLDRDLHNELVKEAKENSGRIGQVCHDHSDVFLASVGKVVALGTPASDLASKLGAAQEELEAKTAGPMQKTAMLWEKATESHARSRALQIMVQECHKVALFVDKARKQAALGRPRGALEAVDDARTVLTSPVSSLYSSGGAQMERAAKIVRDAAKKKAAADMSSLNGGNGSRHNRSVSVSETSANSGSAGGASKSGMITLEETPFGRRASLMLPKIENEVLMGARRGLNRWFLSLRSGGDGANAGRAVLRRCAHSMAVGPGNLGLGGHMPPSYLWRAKVCDNLISRMNQNGRVVRAVRLGYWFERDATKDAQRLETSCPPGMERRAEAFASAFGWYRCWDESIALLVDPSDFATAPDDLGKGLNNSRHGGLEGSRHRGLGGKGRSLGFRAKAKGGGAGMENVAGATALKKQGDGKSKWAALLTPPVLFENIPTRRNDDTTFLGLAESVHPVRRAEIAFKLLGKAEEFVQYYELNRFGDVQIGSGKDDKNKKESRSSLSSLTGDDVGVGTNRIFFAKSLPHLCASVVGFSAVEAALELGHFVDEEDIDKDKAVDPSAAGLIAVATLFRESSEKYERSLVTELGNLVRRRAVGANLAELVRASCLMAAFRSALKIVHPSSTTRRFDKELLAMDVDILMTALKVAQDEQLKATNAIVQADRKSPMMAPLSKPSRQEGKNIRAPEVIGLPFGLSELKQAKRKDDIQFKTKGGHDIMDEEAVLTYSQAVPLVIRSIHARAIACASFALSQEELGQSFLQKKGSGSACYVLDCVEECVNVAAVGIKDAVGSTDDGDIDKAVQVMANVAALQHSLPRLFGTLMRGMCHVGMIRSDQLAETFQYAEATLKGADKACDNQVGTMYSGVYECARGKIDAHLNYALEGFNWVQKSVRDSPNAYCEGLIGYMRNVFEALGPMDEGSRAGLHFSCCGHVAERMVKMLSERPLAEGARPSDGTLAPISKIDAFGLKNLTKDVGEFKIFAADTGVPQLADCFDELISITEAMIDPELPTLLRPENSEARKRKFPYLSLEKVGNILEKYTSGGMSLMGGGRAPAGMLALDKKEVVALLNLVRSYK